VYNVAQNFATKVQWTLKNIPKTIVANGNQFQLRGVVMVSRPDKLRLKITTGVTNLHAKMVVASKNKQITWK